MMEQITEGTGIYVLPAAAFFFASSLMFSNAKKNPERARILVPIASVSFVIGLVLLGLGFHRLFTS